MYYSTDAITGFSATATDGSLGKVLGFGFDDQTWKVSSVIVRVGWLPSYVAMVDPGLVHRVDGETSQIHFSVTMAGLRRQPDIHNDPPVHKLEESVPDGCHHIESERHAEKVEATHLRNTSEVIGYRATAADRGAGKVSDVVVDTATWRVHEFVVREGWLLRTHRTAPPKWVDSIDWASKQVKFGVNRESIRASRAFNPGAPVNMNSERRVVDYTAETHVHRRDDVAL